ncbi:MAG: M67 family metallopeptidase [Anaerolineales bacterium]|nr:M67 family metallopeptidase [Anaerolineales bacterium]
MSLTLPVDILEAIHAHGVASYPEEGAGFLLGRVDGEQREGVAIYVASNTREAAARPRRYLLAPHDLLRAEQVAEPQGLQVIGIFHSHPDHPNRPSEFDREWALPWFSYLITNVQNGAATETRSWRLQDERKFFDEEPITLQE